MKIDPQILQADEWGQVKKSFNWIPIKLILFNANPVLILKRNLPIVKKSFFYVPRGPVLDFNDKSILDEFVNKITDLAKHHSSIFMRIDPEVLEDDFISMENLKSYGFIKARKEIQPRSTFILDLKKDLEKIRANFESKFRYNIHIAEKNGVIVKYSFEQSAIDDFYFLYKETCARQNFIIHPINYYYEIHSNIIKKNMGAVFTAYFENIPIASVVIFYLDKRIWYMYGASSNKYRNVMPNNLLHWEIIRWAKINGFEKYDLWGIPSNPSKNHPLWGVYRFKKGFNAKLVKFIGSYDLPFNKFWYSILDNGIILYQNILKFIKKGNMSDSLSE